jgi:hypothetical protein
MKQTVDKRTGTFKWESKSELYHYFSSKFALSKSAIDQEIEAAMNGFKLRSGKAIDPKELWQKVGMSLERKSVRSKNELK